MQFYLVQLYPWTKPGFVEQGLISSRLFWHEFLTFVLSMNW